MIYKINGKYLQVWNDERTKCVSLGTADKLVKTLIGSDQTKKISDKLTKTFLGGIVDLDQKEDLSENAGFYE